MKILDRDLFESYKTGIAMIWAINQLHPDKMEWDENTMNRLVATRRLENMIRDGAHPSEIFTIWNQELNEFKKMRKPYLLY